MDNDEFLKTIVDPQGIPFDTKSDPNGIKRARNNSNSRLWTKWSHKIMDKFDPYNMKTYPRWARRLFVITFPISFVVWLIGTTFITATIATIFVVNYLVKLWKMWIQMIKFDIGKPSNTIEPPPPKSQADEYEARSNRYSNRVIILLPLSSGNVAVFNSTRELTGISSSNPALTEVCEYLMRNMWRQPESKLSILEEMDKDHPKPPIDLEQFVWIVAKVKTK